MSEHWLTAKLAEDLIAAARAGALRLHPKAAGGTPDRGPIKSIRLQRCDCCENILLFVDGRQIDCAVSTAEDLILNVLFAESEIEAAQ